MKTFESIRYFGQTLSLRVHKQTVLGKEDPQPNDHTVWNGKRGLETYGFNQIVILTSE